MDATQTRLLLERGEFGILATLGKDGKPYGVPLSYVLLDGAIYAHCAVEGRKLDNIRHCPDVTFSIVDGVKPFTYKNGMEFSTTYESACVEGRVAEVLDEAEKIKALVALVEKYMPDDAALAGESARRSLRHTVVLKITPAQVRGKTRRHEEV